MDLRISTMTTQTVEVEVIVSLTVNVNLGKLNEENDIATTKMSLSNEEPSVLS
jgi:hypothetical protein